MSGEKAFDCGHIFPDGLRCRLTADAHQMPGMSHHTPVPSEATGEER